MSLRIVEVKNKKGKIRFRIEERFLFFFWVSLNFSHPNVKSEFKKVEKAQEYIKSLKEKKIIEIK